MLHTFLQRCARSGLMCSKWRRRLDHLVGSHQQRRWNCESERLRSPVVDDQLEPRCLSQRQFARLSATQDLCNLLSRARISLGCGRSGFGAEMRVSVRGPLLFVGRIRWLCHRGSSGRGDRPAFVLAALGPGHLRTTKTTVLMRSSAVVDAMKKAGGLAYTGPKK
jgi:hypothetical protein